MPKFRVTVIGIDSERTQGYNSGATFTCEIESESEDAIRTADNEAATILEFATEDWGGPVYSFDDVLEVELLAP
jgi:hypothetical protein